MPRELRGQYRLGLVDSGWHLEGSSRTPVPDWANVIQIADGISLLLFFVLHRVFETCISTGLDDDSRTGCHEIRHVTQSNMG
ncbi:hypothetical protein KCV05_g70, partial [Aureobasidium melanogenum]